MIFPLWILGIIGVLAIAGIGLSRHDWGKGDYGGPIGDMFTTLAWVAFAVIGVLGVLAIQGFLGWK